MNTATKEKEPADLRVAIRVSAAEHTRISRAALAQGKTMKEVLLAGLGHLNDADDTREELERIEVRMAEIVKKAIEQAASKSRATPLPPSQVPPAPDLAPLKATLADLARAVVAQGQKLDKLPAQQPMPPTPTSPKFDTSGIESKLAALTQAVQKQQKATSAATPAPSPWETLKALTKDRGWLRWAATMSTTTLLLTSGLSSFLWWQTHEIRQNAATIKTQQAAMNTATALGIQIGQEQGGGAWILLPKDWKMTSNPYKYDGQVAVNVGPK